MLGQLKSYCYSYNCKQGKVNVFVNFGVDIFGLNLILNVLVVSITNENVLK